GVGEPAKKPSRRPPRSASPIARSLKSKRCTHHSLACGPDANKEVNTMVTRLSVVAVGVVSLLVLATVPVAAHHAFSSEFDANRTVQLTGVVTKMEWVNPHSWIHIDVKKPDGTVEKWMIEGGTPNTLLRRGLRKQDLQPGTEIKVEGYLAKDGGHRANGRNVTLPNGRALFLGSSDTAAPREGADSREGGVRPK